MNKRFIPREYKEHAKNQCAGWVFYQHSLKVKQSHLINRTIILSALLPTFLNSMSTEELDGVYTINKRDSDYIDNVLAKLDEYRIQP